MPLTYEQAEQVLKAAMANAQENGWRMGVSVVDERGHALATGRMTGAGGATAEVSLGKAIVSAHYGANSAVIADRLPDQLKLALTVQNGGRWIFSQGAVPIKEGDVVVGAVGTSGSQPQNDETCAQAGADAL